MKVRKELGSHPPPAGRVPGKMHQTSHENMFGHVHAYH